MKFLLALILGFSCSAAALADPNRTILEGFISLPKDSPKLSDTASIPYALYDRTSAASLPVAVGRYTIPHDVDLQKIPFKILESDLQILSPYFPDARFMDIKVTLQDKPGSNIEPGDKVYTSVFIVGENEFFLRIGDHTAYYLKVLKETGNCRDCYLVGVDFSGQKLAGVDFSNSQLMGSVFKGSDLSGAQAVGANFSGADLGEANLGGADFSNANFYYASMLGANVVDTQFAGATLCMATMADGTMGPWSDNCW